MCSDPEAREAAKHEFQPHINTAYKSEAPASTEKVYDRLYAASREREEGLALARVRLEELKLADCSFMPDVTVSKASGKGVGVGTVQAPVEGEEAAAAALNPFDRLYAHALERAQRLAVAPSASDLECTFKPHISAVSRKITEGARDPSTADLPRHLMLYEDGLQRQQARGSAEANQNREITDDDITNCTFKPSITSLAATSIVSVPVYDRLYENARAKQATLAAAASGAPLPSAPGLGHTADLHGHGHKDGGGVTLAPSVVAGRGGDTGTSGSHREMVLI